MELARQLRQRWTLWTAVAAILVLFSVLLSASLSQEVRDTIAWNAKPAHSPPAPRAPWLIATISPATGLQRRQVVRGSWQRLYANASRFDARFVIANATEEWLPIILAENATYGDILMLSHLNETRAVARANKTIEFFSALAGGAILRPYEFVSKMDDDTFVDAFGYYEKYIGPLLDTAVASSDNATASIPPTIIGRTYDGSLQGYDFTYAAGCFYTLTWDLVVAAVQEYRRAGSKGTVDEDALTQQLVTDSGHEWHFTEQPLAENFDFGGTNGDEQFHGMDKLSEGPFQTFEFPWTTRSEHLKAMTHGLGPDSMVVHSLKEDFHYLKIASCFDENGFKKDEWKSKVNQSTWDEPIPPPPPPKDG